MSSPVRHGDWCGRRDSNPHILRYLDLNQARLPVPPRPLGTPPVGGVYSKCRRWGNPCRARALRPAKGLHMATQPPPEFPEPSQPGAPDRPRPRSARRRPTSTFLPPANSPPAPPTRKDDCHARPQPASRQPTRRRTTTSAKTSSMRRRTAMTPGAARRATRAPTRRNCRYFPLVVRSTILSRS